MLNYPEKVVRIAKIMQKYGYRAYAVGGCVRDSVMGRCPSDWDMTTSASPEKIIEIFDSEQIRTIPTGLKHGTVTVLLDGETFELTTFRIDGGYTDHLAILNLTCFFLYCTAVSVEVNGVSLATSHY